MSSSTTNLTLDTTGTIIITPTESSYSNVEAFNLKTGSGNDTIKLKDYYNDTIATGGGNDTINSGLGYDGVDGGAGTDLLIVDYSSDVYGYGITSSISSDGSGGFNGYFGIYGNYPYRAVYDQVNFSNIEQFQITGTELADSIYTGGGNDSINSGTGNDTVNGGAGNDTVNGGAGNDIINAGTGNDTVNGGDGTDTLTDDFSGSTSNLTFDTTGTTIITPTGSSYSNVEAFNLTTGSGNDTIKLKDYCNDTIATGAGNDTINSGLGYDNVDGGASNDLLIVNYSSDIYGYGVTSSISSNGSGGFNGYFSVYNYVDQVNFSNIEQFQITGTGLADSIYTGSDNDTINGGAGDDYIDSGAGNDIVNGGMGNDTYIVNTANDKVVENANAGTDTVQSSATFTLSANVENLTLTGSSNINGTGNSANNILTGNSANNTLNGGAGIDILIGGLGNDIYQVDTTTDIITELATEGTDNIQSSVTFSLATLTNIENLTLTGTAAINGTGNTANNTLIGNTANNTLTGDAGNDILNGGTGIDTLIGGLGNDIYQVDSTTDVITELATEGTDTVQSSVTFSLSALTNIENLTLTGTAAINGTGNTANNTLIGNTANNTLTGDAGKDTLTGGLGSDRFSYNILTDSLLANFDVIKDFNANANNDLFLVTTVRTGFTNAGAVATLDNIGIIAKLNTTNFGINAAAQFTFGTRTFVAINDGIAGFSQTTDTIIEVTGLTGTLGLGNFVTV